MTAARVLWQRCVAVVLVALVAQHTVGRAASQSVQQPTVDTAYLGQHAYLTESNDPESAHYAPAPLRLQGPDDDTANTSVPFTRFRFVLANSNNNIRGATASVTTRVRPTADAPSLASEQCPVDRACDVYDEPVQVSVFASRPVLRYALTPKGSPVPFAFIQEDWQDATAASPCGATPGNCALDEVRNNKDGCSDDYIRNSGPFRSPDMLTRDGANVSARLDAHCGAARDPETVLDGNDCRKACCHPCNTTGRVEFRRKAVYGVGPMCTAFEIGARTVGMDFLATVRFGDNVLTDGAVFGNSRPSAPDYAVSRRRSGQNLEAALTNANRTLRVTVLDHSTTEPALSVEQDVQYILLCDYDRDPLDPATAGLPGQGLYNPYVQDAFAELYRASLESDAHAEIPYNDPANPTTFFDAVGGGSVPTNVGLGGGPLSWFAITADHYQYLQARTQPDIYNEWATVLPGMCKPNDTRMDNDYFIPGLDTTGIGGTTFPTACQMSAAINNYTALFNAEVALNGVDAGVALLQTLGAPPAGLSPLFLLERPNMHVHVGQDGVAELIYDPIVAAARPVFAEVGVDVPDHLLPLDAVKPVVEFAQGPNCVAARVLNATTIDDIVQNDGVVANVTAGVAFAVRLVRKEVPNTPAAALSAQLRCDSADKRNLAQLATGSADNRGIFPLGVVDAGDVSDTRAFAFTFYTADMAMQRVQGCAVDVFQYDSARDPPDYYETLALTAEFVCDVTEELDSSDDVESLFRSLEEDAGALEESDSPFLGTAGIVVVVVLLFFVLACCACGCAFVLHKTVGSSAKPKQA